jgi:cystathionine beta-lyase
MLPDLPATNEGASFASLSPAVWRASTVLFPDLRAFVNRRSRLPDGFTYGTTGTPTQRTLEKKIGQLEEAGHCVVLPSGQAAICLVLLSLLDAGDHLLMSDAAYGPARTFATTVLRRMGVQVDFFDPAATGLEALFTDRTRLVWLESPGSITLEIPDVPAIAAQARARNILTALDGTWATSLGMRPLEYGVDLHVQACTKYMGGHSDVLMGCVTMHSPDLYRRLRDAQGLFGQAVSAQDCFLVLRGLETLRLRLERQCASALLVAQELRGHPLVREVYFPPLPGDASHALWRRDFKGGGCLLTVQLEDAGEKAHEAFFSALSCFPLGASWGGVHSVAAFYPVSDFAQRRWNRPPAPLVRLSVGLEDPQALADDLLAGLKVFGAAGKGACNA